MVEVFLTQQTLWIVQLMLSLLAHDGYLMLKKIQVVNGSRQVLSDLGVPSGFLGVNVFCESGKVSYIMKEPTTETEKNTNFKSFSELGV